MEATSHHFDMHLMTTTTRSQLNTTPYPPILNHLGVFLVVSVPGGWDWAGGCPPMRFTKACPVSPSCVDLWRDCNYNFRPLPTWQNKSHKPDPTNLSMNCPSLIPRLFTHESLGMRLESFQYWMLGLVEQTHFSPLPFHLLQAKKWCFVYSFRNTFLAVSK